MIHIPLPLLTTLPIVSHGNECSSSSHNDCRSSQPSGLATEINGALCCRAQAGCPCAQASCRLWNQGVCRCLWQDQPWAAPAASPAQLSCQLKKSSEYLPHCRHAGWAAETFGPEIACHCFAASCLRDSTWGRRKSISFVFPQQRLLQDV